MKIFILTPYQNYFTQQQINTLKIEGGVITDYISRPIAEVKQLFEGTEERILAIDPDFCQWQIPNEIVSKIPNLKAICADTTSFSWIDTAYLKVKNIPFLNLRGFSSIAVAEWAIMMAFILARKVPLIIQNNWKQDFSKHKGIELTGKVTGIIGLGSIGTQLAEKCQGLGMKVVYWSKKSRNARFEYQELPALMENADFIFPCVAQNQETQGLLTDAMLETMKPSTTFVSIVHTIYNHDLLIKMVQNGKLYGYGFESTEPVFTKYQGNIWAGPELAWVTDGATERNAKLWVEAIVNATQGKFPTRVN